MPLGFHVTDSVPLSSLVTALLAVLSGAIFAAADTALTSISSHRLGALIEQSEGRTKATYERIRRDNTRLRTSYLLGRILGVTVGVLAIQEAVGVYAGDLSPYVAAVVSLVFIAVALEVATTLGRKHADRGAELSARLLRPFEMALFPIAWPLAALSDRMRPKDSERPADVRLAEAEVEIMVDEVERSGLFGHEPAEMIRNVLEFADRTADEVMIPRSRIEGIEVDTPIEKVVAIVTESGHSRYPVFREQLDHVVGLLYAKDLFQAIERDRTESSGEVTTTLREILRTPAKFVAESQPLSKLLREMRAQRQHLAIVVDELGGVSGIVTLEDVLEEIVGDIRDEHDDIDETHEAEEEVKSGRVRLDRPPNGASA